MRPSWRCSVKIGMCATMMISIENSVGRPTSAAASRIDRVGARSVGRCCSVAGAGRCSRRTMTAPSTMMPKSIAPSDSRLAGMPRMRQAEERGQQRQRDDQRRRCRRRAGCRGTVQHERHEQRAFEQVVEHRVQRRVDQPGAVVERHDLHALRQDRRVELRRPPSRLQHLGRVLALAHEHDAGDDSSSSSWPTTPWRGTAPTATSAMSRIRIGVPPCSATTMLPMSSGERSRPMPRIRYCCPPCSR